jgi:hypothetical protein
MLDLKTKADFQRLIDDEIRESLTLDYKGSAALSKDSKPRDELCKDVSAFANSAGGQIIYGVIEKNQKPEALDQGADPTITREWIEQVIDSNVQPRIEGLIITPVPLEKGSGYVISIPQAISRGPHQAPDKKYYKRQNFQSVPMDDYEIRDVIGRASKPALRVSFHFDQMLDHHNLIFRRDDENHVPVGLTPSVSNDSNEPALYAVVTIAIDARLNMFAGEYEGAGFMNKNGVKLRAFRIRFNPTKNLPIFKEMPTQLPNIGLYQRPRILTH